MKKTKEIHKERFLKVLREKNIYIKEDIIEKKEKKESPIEKETEKIIPPKKILKYENIIDQLKEAYNEI